MMAEPGMGVGAAQPDSLMHHPLAMVQNQNRKSPAFSSFSRFAPSQLLSVAAFRSGLISDASS